MGSPTSSTVSAGVDICVPFDMDDKKAHINLKKGCQTLDGKEALGFVRARYSDPRGDIGRAERQRQFLGAIMKGAATPSTVLNPFRYWSFTHTSARAVGVGKDTTMREAASILFAMRGASNDSTLSLTVPLREHWPTAPTPAWRSNGTRSVRRPCSGCCAKTSPCRLPPPAPTASQPGA